MTQTNKESNSLNSIEKTVLITGGLGFIGLNVANELALHGWRIRILDNLSPQIHGTIPVLSDSIIESSNIEIMRCDVQSRNLLLEAIQGVQAVIHLAAETGTAQSMYQISHYNAVNTQATANLMDILSNESHTVSKIVLASSRSIYGEGAYDCEKHGEVYPESRSHEQLKNKDWELVCPKCYGKVNLISTPEDAPPKPASIYAATKYAQEDLVRVACEALDIDYAILRLQNVYGEGQSLNNPYTGILSIFSTRIRRGLDLPIFEDGLESRDFVHVDDVARAMRACLMSETPINSVVNVGSGVGTSVMDVARQLVISLNGNVPLRVTSEYRLGDIRHNVADVSRLQDLLSGGARIGLAEGLDRFAAWVMAQPLPEDRLEKANAELRVRKLMA